MAFVRSERVFLTCALLLCGAASHARGENSDIPECLHCGATHGLRPVCVCEPGTKKQPKVEFDVTCEPICIPGCGSDVWPLGGRNARAGCASCCEEPCACPGRVRYCKKLKKETVDEEKPTVERRVAYVCCSCEGAGQARCCGVDPPQQRVTWWSHLTWWWPRGATHSPTEPR